MAIIKCPDCGRDVSDKASSCIHCGCSIVSVSMNTQKVQVVANSVAIIYGIQQTGLLGGTMKLYIDGEYITSVKKWDSVEIPVKRDCVLTAKCGINFCTGKKLLKAGRTTKVQIIYNKKYGSFIMQDIH